MAPKFPSDKIGRDAAKGHYMSVAEALMRPSTTIIEERKRTSTPAKGYIGRDAIDGQYVSVAEALMRPSTTVIERRRK